ncbi:hypothetical protein U3516DRAFT_752129 [Neocallimastix sp. 'constans']
MKLSKKITINTSTKTFQISLVTFSCKSDHVIPTTTGNQYQTNFILDIALISYHFTVDGLSDYYRTTRFGDETYANTIYNIPESPSFRHVLCIIEKHDNDVDADLFDLGLGCQLGYYWVIWVYALTIDPILRSSIH